MTALDLSAPADTTAPATLGDTSSDARQNLIDYASLGGFTLTSETHAWYAAVDTVGSPEEARAASTVLAELRGRDLPATREAATRLAAETTLGELDSVVAVGKALALTLRVRSTLAVLMPGAHESDQLAALAAATASGRWRKEQDAKLTWGQRINLGRAARGYAVSKRPRRSTLHAALVAAAAERADWAAISPTGGHPALPTDLDFLDASVQAVDAACEALAELGRLKVDANPAALSLDALGELVDRLASDEGTLHRLPALRALRESLAEQGYAELVAELTEARADAEAVAAAVTREFGAVDAAPEAEVTVAEEVQQALVPAPREEDSSVTVPETAEPETEAAAPEAQAEPTAEAEAATAEATPEAEVVEVEVVEVAAVEVAEVPATGAEATTPEAAPEAEVVEAPVAEAEVTAPEAAPDVEAAEVEVAEVEAEAVTAPEAEAAEPQVVVEAEPVAVETATAGSLAPRRPRKPAFTPGRPVTAYSADELVSVVRWIDSDGVKRSDDELLRAAMKELGFARLGPRIKESLGNAVTAARA